MWKEKSWDEKKKAFRVGTIIFLFFAIFTFFQTPEYNKKELNYKTIVLYENPLFKKNCVGTVGCNYWLELNPKTGNYKVFGIDYKYLMYKEFKRNVGLGDTIKIGVIDKTVLTLEKNGFQYLRFESAQFHKKRNRLFSRYLFITGFFLCAIPLFFKKHPTIKWEENVYYRIKFELILVLGLLIVFLILASQIGINFILGDEFAK